MNRLKGVLSFLGVPIFSELSGEEQEQEVITWRRRREEWRPPVGDGGSKLDFAPPTLTEKQEAVMGLFEEGGKMYTKEELKELADIVVSISTLNALRKKGMLVWVEEAEMWRKAREGEFDE